MNSRTVLYVFATFFILLGLFSCGPQTKNGSLHEDKVFEKAFHHAEQANEALVRCNAYMEAWLTYADPNTGLVPRRIDHEKDRTIWNARDCAADNYPFLILTSFFTNRNMYNGVMRNMLNNEIRLTSRVKSLPDTYSFSKQDFEHETVSMDRIIFGTSEYIKDGLLPVTEWLGQSPWSERMLTMLDDLDEYVDVAGNLNRDLGNSPEAEVNGELLQVLSRVFWMTGEQKYLDWATQIGDFFLLGEGYPLTSFDYLRLRDHGCELVGGLCELYVTVHFADKEKNQAYQKPLFGLLDYILEYGRNEDGLFYNAINPQTNETVDDGLADTWGYTLNGYYSIYMIDRIGRYKEAVNLIFENLHKYRNYNWERNGADGYADAVEGAINLYNRIENESAAEWIDSEIRVMWSMQDSSHRENAQQWKNSGIIEGWYGDGNFARTSIMYKLWKTMGAHLRPWRPEIKIGAVEKKDTLYIAVGSSVPWKGKLYFDRTRHSTIMNLPEDWPRINQFPEWFTVTPHRKYFLVDVGDGTSSELDGQSLVQGVELELTANEMKRLKLFVD
jgi:hypothetical protein